MNTASPTIEKESFFEYNHLRKKFELYIHLEIWIPLFSDGQEIAGHRPAVSKKKKSKSWDEYEAQNFFRI